MGLGHGSEGKGAAVSRGPPHVDPRVHGGRFAPRPLACPEKLPVSSIASRWECMMLCALPLVVVADKAVEFNTRVCACFPRLLFQLNLPYTVITQ